MKKIPLILSRVLIGILIGLITLFKIEGYGNWIVVLMSIGLVTDIFDGIIARKLNVSSERLRVWDSNVDQFFWLVVIGSIFYLNTDFIEKNIVWIFTIISLELTCYILSYIKFKKSIATHSIMAKIWTLALFFFLIDLTLNSTSPITFIMCIVLGILSRVEIILIIAKIKSWTTDVPSLLVVSKINNGIPIKRNKLFNG